MLSFKLQSIIVGMTDSFPLLEDTPEVTIMNTCWFLIQTDNNYCQNKYCIKKAGRSTPVFMDVLYNIKSTYIIINILIIW